MKKKADLNFKLFALFIIILGLLPLLFSSNVKITFSRLYVPRFVFAEICICLDLFVPRFEFKLTLLILKLDIIFY